MFLSCRWRAKKKGVFIVNFEIYTRYFGVVEEELKKSSQVVLMVDFWVVLFMGFSFSISLKGPSEKRLGNPDLGYIKLF